MLHDYQKDIIKKAKEFINSDEVRIIPDRSGKSWFSILGKADCIGFTNTPERISRKEFEDRFLNK